jgi:hypothetical protein
MTRRSRLRVCLVRFCLSLVAAASLALLANTQRVNAEDVEDGFASLFDGKSLDKWQGSISGYEIKDGVMICQPQGGGNIYTKDEYADFVFRFEFKLSPGANNGVGIRTPLQGDPAYVGMEVQILDDSSDRYKGVADWQRHGSVYGVVAAKRGHLNPVGEWNTEEIAVQGRRIKVTLNGEEIVNADLDEASTPKTIDGKDHPGLKNEKGHIAFCGHGTKVEFRNLRIKELK